MTGKTKITRLAYRYGAAALAAIVPVLITLYFRGLHRIPFALSFLTVSLVAWLLGFWPAILTTVLCALGTNYFFLGPTGQLTFASDAMLQTLVLGGFAVFIAWLTEQNKIARRAQFRAEASYAVTLSSIGDALIATDAEGKVTFMNAVASQLTGWPIFEAKGRPIGDVFHLVDELSREPIKNPVETTMVTGDIVRLANHSVLLSRSGKEISIDDSGAPIKDEEGNLIGAVLVFRDIGVKRAQEREREALLERTQSAERENRETLARYQFLTEALPIYVWMGETGKFEFCNRHVLEFTGLTFEQIQAGGTYDLIHPDDRQRFVDETLRSLRTGTPLVIEYRIRRADGQYRWHLAESRQFTDQNGQVKWLGTAIDLTERKMAEEELRESEARLQLAQTAGGIGIWDWNLVSNQMRWSPEYYARFGLQPGDVEPSLENFLVAIHPNDREAVKETVENSVQRTGKFSREFRTIWPDGSAHWLFYQGTVLRNDLDEPVRMIGICSDITARKLAEYELRSANERLSLALATAQMGDWEWNVREDKIVWSEKVCKLHGIREFDGRVETWLSSVHPDDRARLETAVEQTLRTGVDCDIEYRTLHPDGSTYWVLSRGVLKRDAQAVPVRLIGVCMDINARKQSEEAIRRSEKLAATGRLAASISHEINNPLESVTNLLFLLNASPELSSETRNYVSVAQSEVARISQIATQTLRFYRQSTRPVWADVPALLDSVLSLYQGRITAANVAVERKYAACAQVFCFDGELRQIFVNLIGNAVDAMAGRGGILHVRVRPAGRGESQFVRITVADTGTGIPPEISEHLFEPFFTTKGSTGTGLGLWLSHSMIQKHNGTIRVRTRTNSPSGTVFTLTFPIRAVSSEQATSEATSAD